MKFALITPRYGAEIPAGAEHACRLLYVGGDFAKTDIDGVL